MGGCGNSTPTNTTGNQASNQTVYMDASWARTYHDVKSLKQDSDLVVSGTFTGIAATVQPDKGPVETDFTFTLSKTLVNPQLVNVKTITVRQTGGIVGNITYVVADDPLFVVGAQEILFLHQFAPGQYFVLGGPTGRFQISQGVVHPVGQEGVTFVAVQTEETFEQSIQQA